MDHVPPKCFFPKPVPANLITVPACRVCNESHAPEDIEMRAFLCSYPGASTAAMKLRDAIRRGIGYDRKFADKIAASAKTIERGGTSIRVFTYPRTQAERFGVHIAKGLLAHHYPGFPLSRQVFGVQHFGPLHSQIAVLNDAFEQWKQPPSSHDSRGDGVIDYWHYAAKTSGGRASGTWAIEFYGAARFLVMHDDGESSFAQTLRRNSGNRDRPAGPG